MSDLPYRILETERTAEAIHYRLEIPVDSALMDGHFPGDPILPGVAQVQICTEALSTSLGRTVHWKEVELVRFRRPIRPGNTYELVIRPPDERGKAYFELHSDDGLIADGRMIIADG